MFSRAEVEGGGEGGGRLWEEEECVQRGGGKKSERDSRTAVLVEAAALEMRASGHDGGEAGGSTGDSAKMGSGEMNIGLP